MTNTIEIIEVNSNNFKAEVLESNVLVLVDFWAVWCGPCKIMNENLKELINNINGTETATKVKITKLDVDNHSEIANNYGIRSIPTIILFKNGEPVATEIGLKSSSDLLELINNIA